MSHPMVSLGSVAEFINGVAFKPSDWEAEGKKIVRIQNLTDPEKPFNRTTREVDLKYVIHRGDLLVSWSATLGVFTWDDEETALVNQHIFRVEPDTRAVDRGYLRHMLTDALLDMERHLHGATMKHVNRTEFLATQIPLPHKNGKPDLDEQKRISAILDKADAIRRKRQHALRLTDDFLRSVFLDMFGDPVTNPKGWPISKSGEIFADKPRLGTTRPAIGTGYLVVRVGEIGSEIVNFGKCGRVELSEEELKRFRLLSGDILIARAIGSRDQLGKCSFFHGHDEIVVGDSHVMRLRLDPKKCEPYWFYFLLSSPTGKLLLQSKGGATAVQFNINSTQASDLEIPVPPLSLQSQFVRIAQATRSKSMRDEESTSCAEAFFGSLQQRAFRGEL